MKNIDRKKGFTLVELMIVVVILGILAAIAIPLYMKFVQRSKESEAAVNLGNIARLLEVAYNRSGEQASSAAVPTSPGPLTALVSKYPAAPNCGDVGRPDFLSNGQQVPPRREDIQGKKYYPGDSDWNKDAATVTAWEQIPFAIIQPIMYGYCYEGQGTTARSSFTVFAFSDIDADNIWSQYARVGTVREGRPTIGPLAIFEGDE